MPIMYVNPAPRRRRRRNVRRRAMGLRRYNPAAKKATKRKKRASAKRMVTQTISTPSGPMTIAAAPGITVSAKPRRKAKARKTTRRAKARKTVARKTVARKTTRRAKARKTVARKTTRRAKARKTTRRAKARKTMRRRRTMSVSIVARANPRRRRRRRPNPHRYRMHHRRRMANRRRRNPDIGMLKSIVMKALPIGGGFLVGRVATVGVSSLLGRLPVPAMAMGPVSSVAVLAAGAWVTGLKAMPGVVAKHRSSLLVGLALNALEKVVAAVMPSSLKARLGMGDTADYGRALAEYIQIGAAPPLDDRITMNEYVAVDDYVAVDGLGSLGSLGAMQDLAEYRQDLGFTQELGMEQDLGVFEDRHLGGTHRAAMLAPVPQKKYLAPVPARSFTGTVPSIGGDYDADAEVYTGIFSHGGLEG